MSIESIFNVSVSSTSRTPSRAGFGTALLLAHHSLYAARVRSYSSLAGMVSDGFKTRDPAYKMAAAAFAQNPRSGSVKIGRRGNAFTQVVNLTPSTPVASELFAVKVAGLEASCTADGTPSVAEVCTALAAAINGLADADAIIATGASTAGTQTLTGASLDGVTGGASMAVARMLSFAFSSHADWDATTITVTGRDVDGATITETFAVPNGGGSTVNGTKHFKRVVSVAIPAQSGTGGTFTMGVRAPVTADGSSTTHVACTSIEGQLHSFEMVTSNLSPEVVTTDPGVEADLAACYAADPDFYGVALDSNGAAEIEAAAAWVEANGKLLVVQTADADVLDAEVSDDIASTLKDASYGRTFVLYHPKIATSDSWIAAAMLGSRLPATPGSDTWAFKTLATVSAYALTDAQTTALEGKNVTWYQTLAGVAVTYGGKVAAGEWADVVRFLDKQRATLRERLYALQLAGQKLPYTDAGISAVRAEIAATIKEGQRDGGYDPAAAPTIDVPKVADVSAEDRAARTLPGVSWSMRLAGAIHSMTVTGVATP